MIAERNRRIADALIATNFNYTESEIAVRRDRRADWHQRRGGAREAPVHRADGRGRPPDHALRRASFNDFFYRESLDPKRLAEEIAKASNVIREETGWQLYDPQLEKFIDPLRDADEFARAFGVGVSLVQQIASEREREGQS